MLCPTHLKTACDEFQNGIQKKTLLLGGKPGNSFAASSTNEAVMKNAARVRPKFALFVHRIKGLDAKKNLPVEHVWNYEGETLRAPMQRVHLCTAAVPQGQEDGLPGDHGVSVGRLESRWKSHKKSREAFESSGIPLLLRGSSGRRQEPVERAR